METFAKVRLFKETAKFFPQKISRLRKTTSAGTIKSYKVKGLSNNKITPISKETESGSRDCLILFFEKLPDSNPLRHRCRQEGSIAEDVEDVLTSRHENGFALTDVDAVDIGIAPQTDHDDE